MIDYHLIIALISFIVCLVSFNILVFIPVIVDMRLDNQLLFRRDCDSNDGSHDSIRVKFWFFNVQNPDDVEFNSSKLILREIGPYTYLQKRNKKVIFFTDNKKEVMYAEKKKWIFEPHLSVGYPNDLITLPNVPKLKIAAQAITDDDSEKAAVFFDIVDEIFKKFDYPMFDKYTVEQILFQGYQVELYTELRKIFENLKMDIPKEIEDDEFGLFSKKNRIADSYWQVNTGLGIDTEVFQIRGWNRSRSLNYWNSEKCNQIKGTDGFRFKRHLNKKDKLSIFNPILCKPAELEFKKETKVKDVQSLRFILSEKVFGSIDSTPTNECHYCVRPQKAKDICHREGFIDLSGCSAGAPLLLSRPHFLSTDLDLTEKIVDGLDPDRLKHETYIDIEPITGITTKSAQRSQLNIEVFRNKTLEGFASVQPMVIPILWMEEFYEISNEMAKDLQNLSDTMLISKLFFSILILAAFTVFLMCIITYLKKTGKIDILTATE